jgi:hypothetical protein
VFQELRLYQTINALRIRDSVSILF